MTKWRQDTVGCGLWKVRVHSAVDVARRNWLAASGGSRPPCYNKKKHAILPENFEALLALLPRNPAKPTIPGQRAIYLPPSAEECHHWSTGFFVSEHRHQDDNSLWIVLERSFWAHYKEVNPFVAIDVRYVFLAPSDERKICLDQKPVPNKPATALPNKGVYVLRQTRGDGVYVGISEDISARIVAHQSGRGANCVGRDWQRVAPLTKSDEPSSFNDETVETLEQIAFRSEKCVHDQRVGGEF